MEKAYALKDAREAERQKLVQDSYDRQWRDACDDARTLDSAATTKFMADERARQIQEKINTQQRLTQEENNFLITWKKNIQLMEEQEIRIQKARKEAEMSTRNWVSDQVYTCSHIAYHRISM